MKSPISTPLKNLKKTFVQNILHYDKIHIHMDMFVSVKAAQLTLYNNSIEAGFGYLGAWTITTDT
jgi:hypothetical protein